MKNKITTKKKKTTTENKRRRAKAKPQKVPKPDQTKIKDNEIIANKERSHQERKKQPSKPEYQRRTTELSSNTHRASLRSHRKTSKITGKNHRTTL
ncbi:hypothetical protein V6N11_000223 [Hibiscus sabdariffa]|uniref:Uncharacterized protein n=2 Tax=Hibiscus sabdariffa TaxID=183260 RepID=A0ABR2BBC8_9ROSI